MYNKSSKQSGLHPAGKYFISLIVPKLKGGESFGVKDVADELSFLNS